MTTSLLLELTDVSADRRSAAGTVRVVDDVSLSVAPGELVALMGPSGSGKTSILQVAAGLLAPTSGTVAIDGVVMGTGDRVGWTALRRRTVGMVHQRLDLLAGLDVTDNVALPLLLDGVKVGEAHRLAGAALERLGMATLGSAVPEELSVGRQQLVAVARAVVGDRRLVLADEPTAALDTVSAERVVGLLSDLAAAGTGILMATHDTRLAGWSDRVVELRDGRVVGPDVEMQRVTSDGAR